MGQNARAGRFWSNRPGRGAPCRRVSDESALSRCRTRAARRREGLPRRIPRFERAARRIRLCERARAAAAGDTRALQCEDIFANEAPFVFDQYLAWPGG